MREIKDQRLGLLLNEQEKKQLVDDITKVQKKVDSRRLSISNMLRKRVILGLDLEKECQAAKKIIDSVDNSNEDAKTLQKKERALIKAIEKVKDEGEEQYIMLELKDVENKLNAKKAKNRENKYQIALYITYQEALEIKSHANDLDMTVSEYVRSIVFDNGLTENVLPYLDEKDRLRILRAIVKTNRLGYSKVKIIEKGCKNCQRLYHDIDLLQQELKKYKTPENHI